MSEETPAPVLRCAGEGCGTTTAKKFWNFGGKLYCIHCRAQAKREHEGERSRHKKDRVRRPQPKPSPEQIAKVLENLRRGRQKSSERAAARRAGLPSGLTPLGAKHWEVLISHLSGESDGEIAHRLGYYGPNTVKKLRDRPDMVAMIAQVREKQMERIIAGEFGVRAQAKAAAPKAMRSVIDLSTGATKDADKHAASRTVLQMAGELVDHRVTHHFHQMLQGLTEPELVALAQQGRWPERLVPLIEKLGLSGQRNGDVIDTTAE